MEQYLEFAANHPFLFSALAVVLGMLAWSYLAPRLQGIRGADPGEATQLINHRDAVVVDVREHSEFSGGHIINSVHIPMSQLAQQLDKLEKFKGRPIVVSCRSGSRSGLACGTLARNGFEEVYNLRGGLLAWQNANLPLSRK